MKPRARKNKYGYVGRVEIWENGKYLYSHSTAITRLTKYDALEDAHILILQLKVR